MQSQKKIKAFLKKKYFQVREFLLGPSVYLDRVVMNESTRKLVKQSGPAQFSVLEISGTDWSDFGFKNYCSLQYPEFDVCAPLKLTERFDLIIAEQVFEHLAHPAEAVKNVYRLLNEGGYFLITTPFLQKVHNFPIDCYRWTEIGMRNFLTENGFKSENVVTGSWGNMQVARLNLSGPNCFPFYNKFFHSLKNDPVFPVQVWAYARKELK